MSVEFPKKSKESPDEENGMDASGKEISGRSMEEKIEVLHSEYFDRITKIAEEVSGIQNKPEYKGQYGNPEGYMNVEDYQRYRELSDQSAAFEKRCLELTAEILRAVTANQETVWRRMPYIGVPGALAETNSRHYRAQIGDQYELELSWYHYPEDTGGMNRPEIYKEIFSARIAGTKKVSGSLSRFFRRVRSEFPMFSLEARTDHIGTREPVRALRHFDEETRERIGSELIRQVKAVKQRLG